MIDDIIGLVVLFMFIGSVGWCMYYVKGCHLRRMSEALEDMTVIMSELWDVIDQINDKM